MQDLSSDRSGMPLRRLLRTGVLLAVICYPFAVHSSVFSGSVMPGVTALLLLLGLGGIALLLQRRWPEGGLLILLTLLASGLAFLYGAGLSLLHLPPIIINLILGTVFASTLLPGRIPLISRFASAFHRQELDTPTRRYTRRVTQLWVAVFFSMAIVSWLLAIWASHEVWSLFTNFISYLVVLLVFVIEYQVRIRRLPQLEHPGFVRFLLALRKMDLRSLLGS
jgi:uncharacterized membrane protein